MIFEDIPNFIEQKRYRKALKACIEYVENENITTSEETLILWEIVDKYIPKDPIIMFTPAESDL